MFEASRVANDRVGDKLEVIFSGALPCQQCLGLSVPPRLVRDTTQRKTDVADRAARKLESSGNGNEREGIRLPVANLQVRMMVGEAFSRQIDRSDDLAALQIGID